jgi:hypothetical protein
MKGHGADMKAFAIGSMLALMTLSAAAQQTYEMHCRGGAGLSVKSSPGQYSAGGTRTMHLTLKFNGGRTREKVGSDGTRLNVGHCSWVDRDLRSGEPTEIHFDLLEYNPDRHLYPASLNDDALTEAAPDAYLMPRYMWSSDHFWSFWVYNTNKGYLQSARSRPFKPALQRKGMDVLRKPGY